MMFNFCCNNMTPLILMHHSTTFYGVIICFCTSRSKDYLLFLCSYKGRYMFSTFFHSILGLNSQVIYPRRITVIFCKIWQHFVIHFFSNQRSCCIIQIYHRLVLSLLSLKKPNILTITSTGN